jgi:hypothetical protein
MHRCELSELAAPERRNAGSDGWGRIGALL